MELNTEHGFLFKKLLQCCSTVDSLSYFGKENPKFLSITAINEFVDINIYLHRATFFSRLQLEFESLFFQFDTFDWIRAMQIIHVKDTLNLVWSEYKGLSVNDASSSKKLAKRYSCMTSPDAFVNDVTLVSKDVKSRTFISAISVNVVDLCVKDILDLYSTITLSFETDTRQQLHISATNEFSEFLRELVILKSFSADTLSNQIILKRTVDVLLFSTAVENILNVCDSGNSTSIELIFLDSDLLQMNLSIKGVSYMTIGIPVF